MKRLHYVLLILLLVQIVVSCNPLTPSEPETPGDASLIPSETSEPNSKSPQVSEVLETTLVEFLMDNSSSVEQECGLLGERRYDLVNFLLNTFRAIPASRAQYLFIGTGSFGNDYVNYESATLPTQLSPLFPHMEEPINNQGTKQEFNDAIQKAVSDMNSIYVSKKILVLITDGKFSDESFSSLRDELGEMGGDETLSMLVALICPDNPSLQGHISYWRDQENDILEIGELSNVTVLTLEGMAEYLLTRLNGFFPKNSIVMSSDTYQDVVPIAGYYTALDVRYWNLNPNAPNTTITDTSVENGTWEITPGQPLINHPLISLNDCSQRNLIIPNPGSRWLLVLWPHLFQSLDFSIKTENEETLEFVNGIPLNARIEIMDTLHNIDWSNKRDCFSAVLIWKTNDQLNQVNAGEINLVPCQNSNFLCYTETDWKPSFISPGEVEITVRLKASDGAVWESEPRKLIIKFKPKYEPNNSTPLIVFSQYGKNIAGKNFTFSSVASISQLDVYIVSEGDLTGEPGERCPLPIDPKKEKKVHKVPVQSTCDLGQGTRACVLYAESVEPLIYTLGFLAEPHVFTTCQYDQIYFDWRPDNVTKGTTLRCLFEKKNEEIVCDENETTSRPDFLPLP